MSTMSREYRIKLIIDTIESELFDLQLQLEKYDLIGKDHEIFEEVTNARMANDEIKAIFNELSDASE